MERLTTDDIIPEMAIREMVSIDMQQLSRIYHRLRLYEITGITPDKFAVINQEYTKMAKELADLRKQNRWIPVRKELPEDGTYLRTLDGELCGIDEPFTGMCGIENGVWDEQDCVIAWRPLPEPYKE